jgi:hypothetical protein
MVGLSILARVPTELKNGDEDGKGETTEKNDENSACFAEKRKKKKKQVSSWLLNRCACLVTSLKATNE